MSIFANGGTGAWSRYLTAIEDSFSGGYDGRAVIQPLAVQQRAAWDSDHKRYNVFLRNLLADSITSFNPVANFTGARVSNAYYDFLVYVTAESSKELSAEDKAKLESANLKLRQANVNLRKLEAEIILRWTEYKKDMEQGKVPNMTKRQFEEDRGYDLQRASIREQIESAGSDLIIISHRVGGDAKIAAQAIKEWQAPYNRVALPMSPEEEDEGLKDEWSVFLKQDVMADLSKITSGNHSLTADISETHTESDSLSKAWGASGHVQIGWFGFGGSAGGSSMEQRAEAETISTIISFDHIEECRISRGTWYRPDLFTIFKKFSDAIGGKNGLLNIVPISAFLAKGISIDVTTSNEVSTYSEQTFSASAGFSIGPFSIGGSSSEQHIHSTFERTATGFRIKDQTNQAWVVAIKAFRPFYDTV